MKKKFLEYMSNFLGLSLSKVIKEYTIEYLENLYNTKVGDDALKEYHKNGWTSSRYWRRNETVECEVNYSLKISKETNKTLSEMDEPTINLLLKWMNNNIHNTDTP